MHRAWRRLCLIGAGIVWMTAAGCQEGNQEEPLLEEVEEIQGGAGADRGGKAGRGEDLCPCLRAGCKPGRL